MTTNKTRWLLVGLLCLALWPGAAHGESPELMDAYNRYSELYAQGRYPVAVTSDADAVTICHAHLVRLVDGRLGTGDDLFDEGVVRGLRVADNRHRRAVEDDVTLRQEEQVRGPSDPGEAVCRPGNLTGRGGIVILARVCPDDRRPALAFLVARR